MKRLALALALSLPACLPEPRPAAYATREGVAAASTCHAEATAHTATVVGTVALLVTSLGFEWAALEAPNDSTQRVPLADSGAIAGGVALAGGIGAAIEAAHYVTDGCGAAAYLTKQ